MTEEIRPLKCASCEFTGRTVPEMFGHATEFDHMEFGRNPAFEGDHPVFPRS